MRGGLLGGAVFVAVYSRRRLRLDVPVGAGDLQWRQLRHLPVTAERHS